MVSLPRHISWQQDKLIIDAASLGSHKIQPGERFVVDDSAVKW